MRTYNSHKTNVVKWLHVIGLTSEYSFNLRWFCTQVGNIFLPCIGNNLFQPLLCNLFKWKTYFRNDKLRQQGQHIMYAHTN